MKVHEFILNFISTTKKNIIELAQTELNNENKKLMLDHAITEYIEKALNGLTVNFFIKMVIRKLLIPNVAIITQAIYDLIKLKVEGITKD